MYVCMCARACLKWYNVYAHLLCVPGVGVCVWGGEGDVYEYVYFIGRGGIYMLPCVCVCACACVCVCVC